MGRKRRHPVVKPFCYYCDRNFETEKTLVSHQRARHFKCAECRKRLSTLTALSDHLSHVHKVTLRVVPGALAGRDSIAVSVLAMSNIPIEVYQARFVEALVAKAAKRASSGTAASVARAAAAVTTAPAVDSSSLLPHAAAVYPPDASVVGPSGTTVLQQATEASNVASRDLDVTDRGGASAGGSVDTRWLLEPTRVAVDDSVLVYGDEAHSVEERRAAWRAQDVAH